jgi:hypothetical protein
VEYHPDLVEEAVLVAIDSQLLEARRRFREIRDRIYEIDDPDERQIRFEHLHGQWFVELRLVQPLQQALSEQVTVADGVSRVLVVPVTGHKEEFADLARPPGSQEAPRLLIRLRVSTLVDPAGLLSWLRRELLHVADLLDPEFGFSGSFATEGRERALEKLHQQRYRVLWETSVGGRLVAAGWSDPASEERARDRFCRIFGAPGASSDEQFDRFFHGPRPTHSELVDFATNPAVETGRGRAAGCPVCRMPTVRLHPTPELLGAEVVRRIRRDIPQWTPRDGLCMQCADLYAALSPVPGLQDAS